MVVIFSAIICAIVTFLQSAISGSVVAFKLFQRNKRDKAELAVEYVITDDYYNMTEPSPFSDLSTGRWNEHKPEDTELPTVSLDKIPLGE